MSIVVHDVAPLFSQFRCYASTDEEGRVVYCPYGQTCKVNQEAQNPALLNAIKQFRKNAYSPWFFFKGQKEEKEGKKTNVNRRTKI